MTLDELRAAATLPEGEHRAWDTMAVELEVAEFLYALVRMLKPAAVVECGAGNGYASRFIAEALAANGAGQLTTFEDDPMYAARARSLLVGFPAKVVDGYSLGYSGACPGLVFIDSLGGTTRERDMARWFAHAGKPLIAVHDANGYPPETFPVTGALLTAGRGVWLGRA